MGRDWGYILVVVYRILKSFGNNFFDRYLLDVWRGLDRMVCKEIIKYVW